MSKVIQISVATGGPEAPDILYALCEDGSLWRLPKASGNGEKWQPIQAPPSL